MKINGKSFGFLLAGLVMLPGCMHVPIYQVRSLHLLDNSFDYAQTEQGITFKVKRLNRPEKDYFFNGRMTLLSDIEVIYFSIHNLSYKHYGIVPHGITLPQVSFNDVKQLVKKTDSTTLLSGAAVSSGVVPLPWVLLFTTPVVVYPVLTGWAYLFIASIGAAVVALPLGISFLVQGIKSIARNNRIDKDLKEKIVHKKVVVKSGEKYEGLIFVKASDYRSDFTVTMFEDGKAKNVITFDVNLDKS